MAEGPSSPRPADLPPGYDEDDPYEDDDLSDYPDWWRGNIELFRSHGMRPYRPPRFSDGAVTAMVIGNLEAALDVVIELRAIDPQTGGDWKLWVDGDPVTTIERTRTQGGYSRYELTTEEFEALVRVAVKHQSSDSPGA